MEAGVIALLVGLGSAALTPVAVATGKFVSQAISLQTLKLGNGNFEATKEAVSTAVYAAEQMAKSGQIPRDERKKRAMKIAEGLLKTKKVKYDEDTLSSVIEATIIENFVPATTDEGFKTPVSNPVQYPVAAASSATPPVQDTQPVKTPVQPPAQPPVQNQGQTIDEPFPHSGAVG